MENNVYASPQSDVSEDIPNKLSTKRKVIRTILMLLSALLYRGIYKAAPSFGMTFENSGFGINAYTLFVIEISEFFIWCAFASLLPISFWLLLIFNRKSADMVLNIGKYNFYLSLLCFILFMVAMYIPIFRV